MIQCVISYYIQSTDFTIFYLGKMTPNPPIKLRRFARPKMLARKRLQLNDLENPVEQTPMNLSPRKSSESNLPLQNPQNVPMTPSPQSTAANFKNIYSDPNYSNSFSGDLTAIANQIPSYR